LAGDVRRTETGDDDNFSQCGTFFRHVLDDGARDRLTSNIAGHMANAQEFIRTRAIANFAAADASYGRMIAEKVKALLAAKAPAQAPKAKVAAPLNPPRSVPSAL
jgi:catalase